MVMRVLKRAADSFGEDAKIMRDGALGGSSDFVAERVCTFSQGGCIRTMLLVAVRYPTSPENKFVPFSYFSLWRLRRHAVRVRLLVLD